MINLIGNKAEKAELKFHKLGTNSAFFPSFFYYIKLISF